MTAKHWPEVTRELRMHKSEETHAVCARAIMEIEYQRERADELLAASQEMLRAFDYAGTRLVGAEYHAKEDLKAAVAKAALLDVNDTKRGECQDES